MARRVASTSLPPRSNLLGDYFSQQRARRHLIRLRSPHEIVKIKVLALDLEGTLVSNAMSQMPRKGLFNFLTWCFNTFSRVELFTAVEPEEARQVLTNLVNLGDAPVQLTKMPIVPWTGRYKTLEAIDYATPEECLIVDDDEYWIRPEDRSNWIPIKCWETPYRSDDELQRVRIEIEKKIGI
jgi:NLI interacting factor-like phosphatase